MDYQTVVDCGVCICAGLAKDVLRMPAVTKEHPSETRNHGQETTLWSCGLYRQYQSQICTYHLHHLGQSGVFKLGAARKH